MAKKRQAANPGAKPFDVVAGAQVASKIGSEPSDIIMTRIHGMSPMTETGLDSILRNLGVTTVVACGVSINVGLTNLVMDAVNRGYDVVVPRTAAAGVPKECAELGPRQLDGHDRPTDAAWTSWHPSGGRCDPGPRVGAGRSRGDRRTDEPSSGRWSSGPGSACGSTSRHCGLAASRSWGWWARTRSAPAAGPSG